MSSTFTLDPESLAKLEDSAQRRSISHEEMLRIAIDHIWGYDA